MRGRRRWLLLLASALIGVTVLVAVAELTFWTLPVREASPRVLPSGNDPIARFRPNESWRYSAGWEFFIVNDVRTNNAGWVSEIDYVRGSDAPTAGVPSATATLRAITCSGPTLATGDWRGVWRTRSASTPSA